MIEVQSGGRHRKLLDGTNCGADLEGRSENRSQPSRVKLESGRSEERIWLETLIEIKLMFITVLVHCMGTDLILSGEVAIIQVGQGWSGDRETGSGDRVVDRETGSGDRVVDRETGSGDRVVDRDREWGQRDREWGQSSGQRDREWGQSSGQRQGVGAERQGVGTE